MRKSTAVKRCSSLLISLKQVLHEALEMNRAEALAAAEGSPYEEMALAL